MEREAPGGVPFHPRPARRPHCSSIRVREKSKSKLWFHPRPARRPHCSRAAVAAWATDSGGSTPALRGGPIAAPSPGGWSPLSGGSTPALRGGPIAAPSTTPPRSTTCSRSTPALRGGPIAAPGAARRPRCRLRVPPPPCAAAPLQLQHRPRPAGARHTFHPRPARRPHCSAAEVGIEDIDAEFHPRPARRPHCSNSTGSTHPGSVGVPPPPCAAAPLQQQHRVHAPGLRRRSTPALRGGPIAARAPTGRARCGGTGSTPALRGGPIAASVTSRAADATQVSLRGGPIAADEHHERLPGRGRLHPALRGGPIAASCGSRRWSATSPVPPRSPGRPHRSMSLIRTCVLCPLLDGLLSVAGGSMRA